MTTTAHSGHEHGSNALPSCTMEKAMDIVIKTYHFYSPREKKDDCLSLKDLTELLKDQAPTFLAACNRSRPGYIQELFKQADVDKNKQLTFEETVRVIAILADDAHRISHNEDRCGPDKD
ncbi:protein S100-A8-like [Sceloporus undulatus]|uniref:protein S100-A8-like n=1 Tax=Sceloporus undulatus TaxID=8520 RepID=UPI001C4CFAE9|nr:protein S100-A8-like [Sceloporus undulatus]